MQKKNIGNLAIVLSLIASGLVLVEIIFGLAFVTATIQYVDDGSIETLRFSDMLSDADKLVPVAIALGIQFACILALPLIVSLTVARKGVSKNLLTNTALVVALVIAMGMLKHVTMVMPTGDVDAVLASLTLFALYQPLMMISQLTMVICVAAFVLSIIGISVSGKGEDKTSTTNHKLEFFKKLRADGDITEEEYKVLFLKELNKIEDA